MRLAGGDCLAVVMSIAGYVVKGRSLGMSFWITLVDGALFVDGALLVDAVVRRLKR